MTEEELEVKVEDKDAIDALTELKENTVSKEMYDKVVAEKKKILDAYVKGQKLDNTEVVKQESIDDLRKAFFKDSQTNLEYCTNMMKLRNRIIEDGGDDPFLPLGQNIKPTQADIDSANHVAEVIQQCIDYAQGDSAVFTNELQRMTNDVRVRR